MNNFNERLLIIFKQYSLNASSFADKIGVQRSSMSHILSGRNKPSLDLILKIYQTFPDIDLTWLALGEGNMSKQNTNNTSTIPLDHSDEFDFKLSSDEKIASKDIQSNSKETDFINSTNYLNISNSSDIEQIVIFYKDGTFKTFRSR